MSARVVSIHFGEGAAEETPTRIVLELDLPELVAIAVMTGTVPTDRLAAEFGGWITEPASELYEVIASGVLNRYWDAGLDDVLREVR